MRNAYPTNLLLLLLLALLAGSSLPACATHILGAELTYRLDPLNPLKIRAQLITYSDFSLTQADNAEATVFFGPTQSVKATRTSRTRLPDWKYKNIYFFDYVFPAAGTYTMFYREQNRAVGIVNMADSHNQAYCIATQVSIEPPGIVNQESVQFLTDPIHRIPLGQTTRHQVGAYELEGDSLTFELVPSLRSAGTAVNGYVLPSFVKLNAWTGALTYTNPEVSGEYAFAVKITEYRNQIAIGYVIRDFTAAVVAPPAAFAQALSVTPAAGLTISPQNHVFISPNQVLSLQALLQDGQADSTRLEVYSDLALKTDKFQLASSASQESKTVDLRLEADAALQRNAPYLILLRAVSEKKDKSYPLDSVHTQEKGLWIYIGSDIVSGMRRGQTQPARVFPNPAGETVNIEVPRFRGLQLRVYDLRGRLVWQQALVANRTTLPRRQLPAGKYLYTIAPRHQGADKGRTYSGHFIFR